MQENPTVILTEIIYAGKINEKFRFLYVIKLKVRLHLKILIIKVSIKIIYVL